MKKSLIVIALALLMLVPVFADTTTVNNLTQVTGESSIGNVAQPVSTSDGDKNSTTVHFTLLLNPKYVFGITTTAFDADKIVSDSSNVTSTKKLYSDLEGVSSIEIPTNSDTLTFSSPATTYYISYWFKDCTQNCTLTASIDQHLTLQDGDKNATYTDTDKDKYTVKYQAKIEAVSDTAGDSKDFTATTILSPDRGSESDATASTEITTVAETDLLGKVQCGNLKITIGPVSGTAGSDSIANKKAGKYVSHIILTLTADAPAGNNNNDNTQS